MLQEIIFITVRVGDEVSEMRLSGSDNQRLVSEYKPMKGDTPPFNLALAPTAQKFALALGECKTGAVPVPVSFLFLSPASFPLHSSVAPRLVPLPLF